MSSTGEKLPETVLPEVILEKHISKTSLAVKQTDLLTSLLVLLSGILALALSAVFADHWFISGGLNVWQRFGFCIVFFAFIVFFVYRIIVPVLRRNVNPLYAADLIEQTAPSLKNSLINWLLLRKERSKNLQQLPLAERMFDGITKTAAAKVSGMPAERSIDSRGIFWSGTAAAVFISAFVIYLALSPKSPLQTLSRIMLPFADIERPQAVDFRNIKPGNTVMLQGERLTVTAEVFGQLKENVYLVFSTKDGQAVNQRVPMSFDKDAMRYEADFPPGKQGFISDTQYFLEQGANQSRTFDINVHPTASIEVTAVKYKYPLYTGLEENTVTEHGDIKAVEGTEATVSIHSSLPLDEIKLVFDNQHEERMQIAAEHPDNAAVRLDLKRTQTQKSFSFAAKDKNGYDSRRSGIFQYEAVADLPPKVQWSDTAEHLKGVAQWELAEDAALELPVQAEDPDFALRYLRFKMESGDRNIKPVDLLESPSSGPTLHKGQISKTHRFVPKESRLSAGDTAEIWFEATDTKFPGGNTAETMHIKITVTKPQEQDKKQNKQDSDKDEQKQNEKKKDEKKQNEEKKDEPNQDKPQENKDEKKQNENKKDEPNQDKPQENKDERGKKGGQSGNQDEQKNGGQSGNAGKENADKKGGKESSGQAGGDKSSQDKAGNQAEQGGKNPDGESKENENTPKDNQDGEQKDGESGDAGQKGAEQKEQQQQGDGKDTASPNPETQDGDAIEKIAEQMEEEGKLDKNKLEANSEKRQRDDKLDADSKDTDTKGGNSNEAKKRNEKTDSVKPKTQDKQNAPPKQGQSGSESKDAQKQPQQGQDGKESKDGQEQSQQGQDGKESEGGQEKKGEKGTKSGSQNGEGKDGKKSSETAKPGQQKTQGSQNSQQQNGKESANVSDKPDGQQSDAPPQQQPTGGGGTNNFSQETAKEEANLEYADKVTNLVLEYLEEQMKNEPNEELLQKLGWTPEQLRRFYEKWKKMSDANRKEAAEDKMSKDWLEAIKSLGLQPDRTDRGLQDNQTKTKDKSRFTESQRFAPPEAVKDKFKRYSEGIGR